MNIIRNILLILLSIILVITIPLTTFFYSLKSTILKPYATITYINQSGVYEKAEILIKQMLSETSINDENNQGEDIILQIINQVVEEHITGDWLAIKLENIQVSIWDYILNKTNRIEPFHMEEYQAWIMNAAEGKIEALSKENGIPSDKLKETIEDELKQKIPQSIDMTDMLGITYDQLDFIKLNYQKAQHTFRLFILLNIAGLLLGALLAFRFRKILFWVGLTTTIAGVFSLIPVLVATFFNGMSFVSKIELPESLKLIEVNVIRLIELIVQDIFKQINIVSLFIIVFGAMLLLLMKLIKSNHTIKAEESL